MYVKLGVGYAPGMPGTFSTPPRVSHSDIHHGACVTHVPWCMLGSLTSGFLWSRWRRIHSRHSQRMRNPQFYASGKRPIAVTLKIWCEPLSSVVNWISYTLNCVSRQLWCICEKAFPRSMLIHHQESNSLNHVVDSSLQYSGFSPQNSFSGHSYLGPVSSDFFP